jgi:hypothetical protein
VALGSVVGILLLGLIGIWRSVEGVSTDQPQVSITVGELLPSAIAGQTFVAEYSGLSRIQVLLATYARSNTGPLTFHLRSSPDAQEDLVTLAFDAADVVDNTYYAFEFPPIRGSAGRSFYFCLEAAQAAPGNAVTAWGSTEDVYPDGEAVLQGLEGNGVRDLTFRLGYNPPLWQRVSILAQRLTANKPSVWGDVRLYAVLTAVYAVLLFLLFVRFLNAGTDEEKDDRYLGSCGEQPVDPGPGRPAGDA